MADSLPESGELSQSRQWLRVALAPLMLCLVASRQIQTARTSDLSPWKGGGFGMFSTVDSPSARFVHAWLKTPHGEIPIEIPEWLRREELQLRTAPSPSRADAFATRLATSHWIDSDQHFRKIGENVAAAVAENSPIDRDVLRTPRTIPPTGLPPPGVQPRVSSSPGGRQARLPVRGVRLEVVAVDFDREANLLIARRLVEADVTLPTPRQESPVPPGNSRDLPTETPAALTQAPMP